jgi:hypothetical protein
MPGEEEQEKVKRWKGEKVKRWKGGKVELSGW